MSALTVVVGLEISSLFVVVFVLRPVYPVEISVMTFNASLTPHELRRQLVLARQGEDRGAALVAYGLRWIEDQGYFRTFGYSSIVSFGQTELALSNRQVLSRIRVARALDGLPKIRAAFEGRLLWFSAVREIVRVATPATEAEWIARAQQVTLRKLERLVSSSKNGEVPREPKVGLPGTPVKVTLEFEPHEMALAEVVAVRHAEEMGGDPDLKRTVMELLRWANETEPETSGCEDRQSSDGGREGGDPEAAQPNANHSKQRRVRRKRREVKTELTYVVCRECREGAVASRDGFVATTPEHIRQVEATARIHDACNSDLGSVAVSGPTRQRPRGDVSNTSKSIPPSQHAIDPQASDDQLAASTIVTSTIDSPEVPEAERDRPTPAWLRNLVLVRDGHRCTVPECLAAGELQVHHIRWRRHGGRTVHENLTSLCPTHHSCVHNGQLVLSGQAPTGLHFETVSRAPTVDDCPDDRARRLAEILAMPTSPDGEPDSPALDSSSTDVTHVGPFDPRPLHGELDEINPRIGELNKAHPGGVGVTHVGLEDFRQLPDEIDSEFWTRYRGCFEWKRGGLMFRPGMPEVTYAGSERGDDPRGSSGAESAARLGDLVGHREAVRTLSSWGELVRKGQETPAGLILTGRPGMGKSTLARAFARELGTGFHALHGGTLKDGTTLLSLLAQVEDGMFSSSMRPTPYRRRYSNSFTPRSRDGSSIWFFAKGPCRERSV